MMGVGIVGCGGIGRKRATSLAGARLVACADVVSSRAAAVAALVPGAVASPDWHELLRRADVDVVVISTSNDALVEVACAALQAGKHVLMEKPAARSYAELNQVLAAAQQAGRQVRVGFNHRYHPALLKARELFNAGEMGPMMFIRGRYGHGGRVGYDREWRANPAVSGGGELIDQGVHLIDLARWFLGDFVEVSGFAHTYFWDMPVDDNAFMLLKTAQQQVAFLHVTYTEWKNLFSLEIYGRDAKLHIEGLGGSYGTERLAFYKMLPQMGPPETTIWEFPGADASWNTEFAEFLEDIRLNRVPSAGLAEALATLAVVEKIYAASKGKK